MDRKNDSIVFNYYSNEEKLKLFKADDDKGMYVYRTQESLNYVQPQTWKWEQNGFINDEEYNLLNQRGIYFCDFEMILRIMKCRYELGQHLHSVWKCFIPKENLDDCCIGLINYPIPFSKLIGFCKTLKTIEFKKMTESQMKILPYYRSDEYKTIKFNEL